MRLQREGCTKMATSALGQSKLLKNHLPFIILSHSLIQEELHLVSCKSKNSKWFFNTNYLTSALRKFERPPFMFKVAIEKAIVWDFEKDISQVAGLWTQKFPSFQNPLPQTKHLWLSHAKLLGLKEQPLSRGNKTVHVWKGILNLNMSLTEGVL